MSVRSSPSAPSRRSSQRRTGDAPSGKLLLRMPPELHAELADAADAAGTSLNQHITGVLARSLEDDPAGSAAPAAAGSSPFLRRLLVANVLVVGLAALAGIAIALVAVL